MIDASRIASLVCVAPSLVGFFAKPCLNAEGLTRFRCVGKPVSGFFRLGGEGGSTSLLGARSCTSLTRLKNESAFEACVVG